MEKVDTGDADDTLAVAVQTMLRRKSGSTTNEVRGGGLLFKLRMDANSRDIDAVIKGGFASNCSAEESPPAAAPSGSRPRTKLVQRRVPLVQYSARDQSNIQSEPTMKAQHSPRSIRSQGFSLSEGSKAKPLLLRVAPSVP